MPKKPTEKVETEEKVEIQPEPQTKPQPTAEVELDVSTGKPVEASRPAEPSVSAEEFRKLQARMEYQARQFERSQRDWESKLASMQTPQPVVQTEKPVDDEEIYGLKKEFLNQIGQTDWTKPVAMMAEKIAEKKAEEKFNALMEAREKRFQELNKQQATTLILEKEKNWVLEQEPSLNDETSDQFRGFYATYNRMIQEDPTLLQNPRAPRLVYREWKAEQPTQETVKVNPEVERLKRVTAGVAPQGRPTSAPKTIKLTQAELDMCNDRGISPAVYASMKDANFKEGVTA